MDICKTCYKRRDNKRKALDYLFTRKAKDVISESKKPFLYVTLGADEILDVADLMKVLYFEDIKKIISYEQKASLAKKARSSLISNIFNNWHKNPTHQDKLEVIHKKFPESLQEIICEHNDCSRIFFYDDTGWFDDKDAEMLADLLKRSVIDENNLFIITAYQDNMGWSPIKERVITQYKRYFHGKIDNIEEEVVKNNSVDIFVDLAVKVYNNFDKAINNSNNQLHANLITKVKYQDPPHDAMGLWAYNFTKETFQKNNIPINFEKSYLDKKIEDINLFRELFIADVSVDGEKNVSISR